MPKPLTPNQEMYLKTIYEIVDEGSEPRVKSIAERLGVRMPSVTGALETLRVRGLVSHDRYGDVRLTVRGRKTAREVKTRNDLLHKFLLEVLKLPPEIAARDACVLEHVVSPVTLERLESFLNFLRVCNRGASETIAHFEDWLSCQERGAACRECPGPGGKPCAS
ncbi:MAG TPA: metal-dependent transcriptional regulator [Candidatus Krumholzibacteria bacterium]|nr:metal-dependent transcriptional regulator [Candidatus Krumholzibacteria bacterium]